MTVGGMFYDVTESVPISSWFRAGGWRRDDMFRVGMRWAAGAERPPMILVSLRVRLAVVTRSLSIMISASRARDHSGVCGRPNGHRVFPQSGLGTWLELSRTRNLKGSHGPGM